jgi:uncharacterized protein
MLKKCLFILWLLPFLTFADQGNRFPSKPDNYVTDKALILDEGDVNALNARLKSFEDSSSNQIFVYITTSLNGENMEQLCQDMFHDWHIGQTGKNNGVLIAIFTDNHKFRIHTGYGLEGQLPDLLTKRIQDEVMRPHFKKGNYYKGIDAGIDQLIYYTKHTYVPEPEKPFYKDPATLAFGWGANLLFLLLYVRNVLRGKKKPSKKKKKQQENSNLRKTIYISIAVIIAVLPCVGAVILLLMVIMTSNFDISSGGGGSYSSSSSSSYDSSSSWSSSSSSSSDFGGGGGGDSGGGGSSSDW